MDAARDQRPKFDTLFTDARHFRGDCRLVRRAVRAGWMDSCPQADRDALVARLVKAGEDRRALAFASEGQQVRALLAYAGAVVQLTGEDQRAALAWLRYCWAGERTAQTTGRPRERWHVAERPDRIDANAVRRQAKAQGFDLKALRAILVQRAGDEGDAGERVALAVVAERRYGWRVWLVCPRCHSRRAHLYPTRTGVRCRACARIGYGPAGAGETRSATMAPGGMTHPTTPDAPPSRNGSKGRLARRTEIPKSPPGVPPVVHGDVPNGRAQA